MTRNLPSARLELTGTTPEQRLAAFREANPTHVVDPSPAMIAECGPLGVTAWHLGPILFGQSRLGSLLLSRREALIRRDQVDHVTLALGIAGRWRGHTGAGFDMAPGEISVVDLARPMDTELRHAAALQVVFPRDVLDGLDPGGAHGTILRGGLAALLGDFLMALDRRLPELRPDEVPQVAQITIDLFTAALRPSAEAAEQARMPVNLALLQRVRGHVETQLHDPGLTPAAIAAALRISRARLYALLDPFGGVAAFVRGRRLARAYGLLRATAQPVKEIAYAVGFVSEAHFSRAFRQAYGSTPSEARAGAAVAAAAGDQAEHELWLRWMQDLR